MDRDIWEALAFNFNLSGSHFYKEEGTVDYEVNGCVYEFDDDDAMTTLILFAVERGVNDV